MSIIQKLALRLLSPESRRAIVDETVYTDKEAIAIAIHGILSSYSKVGPRTATQVISTLVRHSDVVGQLNTMAADKKARIAITEQYGEISKTDLAALIALGRAYNA
ncbi:hypothetical protein PHABIO_267 [Pseudomonas phage Phabio]|uniref:Uncharacterized protein n=1 Tax=Pseudomonas phage Phabio TaxID=2006668 RepID=A0A1Y0T085_9CAUD|nr:hypothetical protein MZD05_gp267 [Pseudomonas phage Phabio]ARV76898.1 hypothetical protein PHABIO_267 [Pseudomonas phage Phabio]